MECKLIFLVLSFIRATVEQGGSSEIFEIGPGVFKETKTRSLANMVFLSQDGAMHDGILAGFTVYLIQDTRVELQIWRPVNLTKSSFKLISTYPYTRSAGLRGYQDIYIKNMDINKECVRIAKGDRIGIFYREAVWPIPYAFVDSYSPDNQRSLVLNLKGKEDNYTEIQSIDELIFPYQFSAVARVWNFTNISANVNPDVKQTVPCPDVIFPYLWATTKPTSTVIPRTPPMGDSGATGATGATGVKGFAGSTGPMGYNGSKGATGEMGPIGVTGITGLGGAKGETGLVGPTGLQGQTGLSGFTGASGPVGVPGPPGKNGTDAVYGGPGSSSPSQVMVWKWTRSRSLIIGLYAWSVILSTLIVIAFLCSVVLMDRVRKEKNKNL